MLRDVSRARGPGGLREWRAWGEVPAPTLYAARAFRPAFTRSTRFVSRLEIVGIESIQNVLNPLKTV